MPPDDERDYEVGYGKPPRHTRFVKGQSGNPRGRPPGAKNMNTLLTKALNELVVVTDNGGRRMVTKREAIVTQMVNESAGANLRATKMLIDMMKDIEKKTSAERPPEPHRFAPADEEVIKGVRERIRGAMLQEIQDLNAGNPALEMISLPLARDFIRHRRRKR